MRPHSFTKNGDDVRYHYTFSELREWLKRGREHGDCGVILTMRQGDMFTHRGFGTIENPTTGLYTWHAKHFPPFDGPMLSDESLCGPDTTDYSGMFRFTILDFSKSSEIIKYVKIKKD